MSSAYVDPMIASPPIETAVDCPRPAALSVLQISVVMPPERDMTPTGPFLKARRTFTAGPPRPPIFASSGDRMPRQFGPMMRAPRSRASSTICATSPRGMRSVTTTTSLIPASIASNTASRVKRGGTVTIDPSTRCFAVMSRTQSWTGTPYTSRPARPGVTPPTIFVP
jgi:hypothetical protein